MKADIIFLRTLSKELRFLNDEEKDLTITEYRTMIDERHQKGENIATIIDSFEPPKTIARNIYSNAGLKYESLGKSSQTSFLALKWLSAFLSLIPQSILLILALTLIVCGITIGIGTIPVFVLIWMNFEPAQAWGAAILVIGLLPLVAIILFFVGRQFFKFAWFFIKLIWKNLTSKASHNKVFAQSKIKLTKIFFVIIVPILTVLTIAGTIGTFVGEKSIGKASITGNLLHTQTEVLDLSQLTNENKEAINISCSELVSISWYQIAFIKDENMGSNLEINRAHNTKESLKIDFSVEKQNYDYAIKFKMPWNLLIFNISSNKFTLKYNPAKINLKI